MRELKIPAYAKINLTLDVLGKRPDGYHEVEMIMQSIDLHDEVILRERVNSAGITIISHHEGIPVDQTNLAYRAAELLMQECGLKRGIEIEIVKNIPIAAGLAGGSTNGAAVLTGLNRLWDLKLSDQTLCKLGAKLGADVPFCLIGGTVLATGIGTDLKSVTTAPELDLILVKPKINVSTKEIYTHYTPELIKKRPDTQAMIAAIASQDVAQIKKHLVNVLEAVTLHYYPLVAETKKVMQAVGLNHVLMSGSGPTLFAIVDSPLEAHKFVQKLEQANLGQVIQTKIRK